MSLKAFKDVHTLKGLIHCVLDIMDYALEHEDYELASKMHAHLELVEDAFFAMSDQLKLEGYRREGIAFRLCMDCHRLECVTENPHVKKGWHETKFFGFHGLKHIGDFTHGLCPDCEEKRK